MLRFTVPLAATLVLTPLAAASDWSEGPTLLVARAGCAVAIDPSCRMIVTGGRVTWSPGPDGTATNTVEFLDGGADPLPRQWSSLEKPMLERREFHATACVNGFLYVFGGSNSFDSGTVYLNTAERLDLLDPNAVWESIDPMPTARNTCGAVVDDYGRIYIIGGSDGRGVSLPTVERFDPARNAWDSPPSLADGRSRSGVAKDGYGRIYVIGGGVNLGALASVERFDPDHPELGWEQVEEIPLPFEPSQTVTAATGVDGRIYVPGGITAQGSGLNRCLRYDPKVDSWEQWLDLPSAVAPDSNTSVTDCHGNIWLVGAYIGAAPTLATYFLTGPCGGGDVRPNLLDMDANGSIDIDDLLNVISQWGNCP